MTSNVTETTPLVQRPPSSSAPNTKAQRSVTFDPNVSTSNGQHVPASRVPSGPASANQEYSQPMLAGLSSKLRRRHSSGAPLAQVVPVPRPKAGAQRTTKQAQKLKLLPNPDYGEEGPDEESGREVYSQFTRISDPIARRDASRLGKDDREKLPRVTAYCTASSYNMDGLMKFLKGRGRTRGAAPKLFDECIYTPFNYSKDAERHFDMYEGQQSSQIPRERRHSDSAVEVENSSPDAQRNPLTETTLDSEYQRSNSVESAVMSPDDMQMVHAGATGYSPDFDTRVHVPEVFLFNYGTVVIWGMSVKEERRFLKDISKFEVEKLSEDDVQDEKFNFYYTREYQARIYNDFISLRDKKNYMTKLAISHALAQSVKTSLYEDLLDTTIDDTKEIPRQIATTGKVNLSRTEINQQIGELFILRINIHLQGSVLDSPELMWAEPQLDPVYQAVRNYLEMDQRVTLLTERLDVVADLLAVLKDQLTQAHGEGLEWIVIVLIAAEILVAAINIVVDLYAEG